MTTDEGQYLDRIDEAMKKAAKVIDLEDFDISPDGELSDDEMTDLHGERHHCGTCEIRTVMEIVWPAVEEYIGAIKSGDLDAANA